MAAASSAESQSRAMLAEDRLEIPIVAIGDDGYRFALCLKFKEISILWRSMFVSKSEDHQLGQYIPLHYHFHMLNDRARMEAFKAAIRFATPSGGNVLELGGGSGTLSFFAAQKAAQVWCVERNSELVTASRKFLRHNQGGDRVTVVHADAADYTPPEPVDVVICEMLHVGLLREKQVQVIAAFCENYKKAFGGPLPVMIPAISVLAVQPVEHSFLYSGFEAPIPHFQSATRQHFDTIELGDPAIYAQYDYSGDFQEGIQWEGTVAIDRHGKLNALRFITNNLLANPPWEKQPISWSNQFLVLPLDEPIEVRDGDLLRVKMNYQAGDLLAALSDSMHVQRDTRTVIKRAA